MALRDILAASGRAGRAAPLADLRSGDGGAMKLHGSDGMTVVRGNNVSLHIRQMGVGEREPEDDDKQQTAAEGAKEAADSAACAAAPANCDSMEGQCDSLVVRVQTQAVIASAVASTSLSLRRVAAECGLPADLLPPVDPAFMSEPEALDGFDATYQPMSDMWQACGYHNLSDLMPDNIIRAFDTRKAGSDSAYRVLQDMERTKEARVAKYGDGPLPAVTAVEIDAMAVERLKCLKTHMDSRPHASQHNARSSHSALVRSSCLTGPCCVVLCCDVLCLWRQCCSCKRLSTRHSSGDRPVPHSPRSLPSGSACRRCPRSRQCTMEKQWQYQRSRAQAPTQRCRPAPSERRSGMEVAAAVWLRNKRRAVVVASVS